MCKKGRREDYKSSNQKSFSPIKVGAGAILYSFSVSLHLQKPLTIVTSVVVELVLGLCV